MSAFVRRSERSVRVTLRNSSAGSAPSSCLKSGFGIRTCDEGGVEGQREGGREGGREGKREGGTEDYGNERSKGVELLHCVGAGALGFAVGGFGFPAWGPGLIGCALQQVPHFALMFQGQPRYGVGCAVLGTVKGNRDMG